MSKRADGLRRNLEGHVNLFTAEVAAAEAMLADDGEAYRRALAEHAPGFFLAELQGRLSGQVRMLDWQSGELFTAAAQLRAVDSTTSLRREDHCTPAVDARFEAVRSALRDVLDAGSAAGRRYRTVTLKLS